MSMSDRDGFIWYNNEMVNWRDATTHVLTHTLHYGMGVFEGVRAYETAQGPAIFRLQEHTKRFEAACLCPKMRWDGGACIMCATDAVSPCHYCPNPHPIRSVL